MNKRFARGFTLIELMLAMSFVSILLISIAMLTIQISHLYTRGLTMKEINQAGTEVSDDIRREIAEADIQGGVGVRVKNDGDKRALCTGKYSYIVNGPSDIETNSSRLIKYQDGTVARLAKVNDLSGAYCTALPAPGPSLPFGATELLGGGDRSLVVRNLAITPSSPPSVSQPFGSDYASGRMLYTVTLTLSTGDTSELNASASQCLPPSDVQSGAEYCAIDTFRIVARVGNTYRNE